MYNFQQLNDALLNCTPFYLTKERNEEGGLAYALRDGCGDQDGDLFDELIDVTDYVTNNKDCADYLTRHFNWLTTTTTTMTLNRHKNGSTMISFNTNKLTVFEPGSYEAIDCVEITATLPDNTNIKKLFMGKDAHNEAMIQRYKYDLVDKYCHF